jgi:SAM-dependent methyltransferase
MPDAPLHTMDPTRRFTSLSDHYARWRPDYPAAAIELVLEGFHSTTRATVVDLGAGTGISASMFARRGKRVLAVEPNASMRAAGASLEGVEWIDAPAENTTLPDRIADVAVAFQAFHWFEPDSALREAHRILKPDGRFAAVWNKRDRRDPFTADYSRIITLHARHHPAEERAGAVDPLYATSLFGDPSLTVVAHSQRLPLEGLLGRAASTSYLPKEGREHEALIAGLTELHRRWADSDGMVELVYTTEVYRLQRAELRRAPHEDAPHGG